MKQKLVMPDMDEVNVSLERKKALAKQVDTHLRPVPRQSDFDAFDLDRAFRIVQRLAERAMP